MDVANVLPAAALEFVCLSRPPGGRPYARDQPEPSLPAPRRAHGRRA
jgi:hypothetical protein